MSVHPAVGTLEDFRELPRSEAHARGPEGHHRAGAQPHLRPAPVVPARAARAAGAPGARLLRVERRPREVVASAHHLPRLRDRRTGPGIRSRRPTSGIASSPHQPDLNFDNPAVRRGDVRRGRLLVRRWGSTACGSTPCPYLFEREGTNCENLPETHGFLKAAARSTSTQVPEPDAARGSQPVAGRRRRLFR